MRRSRGLVAGVPVNALRDSDLFRFADYPSVTTNLGVVIDRSAIQFAKDKSATGDFVCVCPRNIKGLELVIFARPDVALDLFDRAVRAPRPGWIFPKLLSRYWVLTFEQQAGIQFLFEAEEAKNMEFLSAALRAAHANLHHPATILRGLAAAEILAAADGKPAALYNGHKDRSIDRSVLRLAKKLGSPPVEFKKLARDAVAVIADHSSAAKEIWLSDEARRLWRTRQIDLHARLK